MPIRPSTTSTLPLLLLSLILASASARQGDSSADGEGGGFAFRAMAFSDDAFEGIQFENASGGREEIAFRPNRRTQVMRVADGTTRIEFFDVQLDAQGRETQVPLAVADVSGIADRALVVFFSRNDAERGLPYTALAIDESEEVFGPGAYRFLNLTSALLMVRLGDRVETIGAGVSNIFSFDVANRVPLRLGVAVEYQARWQKVYGTAILADRSGGTLVVVRPPTELNSLSVRVQAIPDRQRRVR